MIKKNKNGLPLEVKYCKNCNLSNQQPTSTNEYFHTQDAIQQTSSLMQMELRRM